jgi:hypothetical protein
VRFYDKILLQYIILAVLFLKMKKEYFLAKDRIVFICLFITLALIVALRGFYLYFTIGQPEWILPGLIPLLIAIILFPVLTTRKVTITPVSIIRVGMLNTKEIMFADIAGYRLRRIPHTGRKKAGAGITKRG